MKVSVIGSGSWGTALANVLSDNGHEVSLWSRNKDVCSDINHNNNNSKYLKDARLNSNLSCTTSLQKALSDNSYVLFVVPSHAMRDVVSESKKFIAKNAIILHASKGIEVDSLLRMSEVIKEVLGNDFLKPISVISGPSHAEEVVLKKPTTVSVSNINPLINSEIQTLFSNEYFRTYTNKDIIGVELGGSLKNIIALASGIIDGLGFGDNAKAALLTRGLTEITRLGVCLGANPLTFSGLTGIGDLIVTGTSKHSRNWKTGNLIAKGFSLEEASTEIGMVSEGIKTTKSAFLLSQKLNVDMPITHALYSVLFESNCPKEATKNLMNREYKDEIEF